MAELGIASDLTESAKKTAVDVTVAMVSLGFFFFY